MDEFIKNLLSWEDEVQKRKGALNSALGLYEGARNNLEHARDVALIEFVKQGGTYIEFMLAVQDARARKIMDEDDGTFR